MRKQIHAAIGLCLAGCLLTSTALCADDGTGQSITVLSAAQQEAVAAQTEAFVQEEIIAAMPDLQKVSLAVDYLAARCTPQALQDSTQTAWDALAAGQAGSAGYARAFKALCEAAGVSCRTIHMAADAGGAGRWWNLVQVDGVWYHCDVYAYDRAGTWSLYNYVLIGDEAMQNSGLQWDTSLYPACPKTLWEDTARLADLRRQKWLTTAGNTSVSLTVDGTSYTLDAYEIAGSNYISLRDLAAALRGTAKQFDVTWDESNREIQIRRGVPYTLTGAEFAQGDPLPVSYAAYNNTIDLMYGDRAIDTTPCEIRGSNYFKLRDLMAMLDCSLIYDAQTGKITIDTQNGYVE